MVRADALVVGAGVTGTLAAIQLAQVGAAVTLIDSGENAGSAANAGSLHVQMQSRFMRLYPEQVPRLEAALPLYRAAAAEWAALDARLGPFDLVREGGLMLAEGPGQLRFLEAKAAREAARGLSVEILDRAGLDRIRALARAADRRRRALPRRGQAQSPPRQRPPRGTCRSPRHRAGLGPDRAAGRGRAARARGGRGGRPRGGRCRRGGRLGHGGRSPGGSASRSRRGLSRCT